MGAGGGGEDAVPMESVGPMPAPLAAPAGDGSIAGIPIILSRDRQSDRYRALPVRFMPVPRLSLDVIRLPAFLYGPDGTILAANDLAEALAGRELAGSTAADALRIFTQCRPDGTPLMPASRPSASRWPARR